MSLYWPVVFFSSQSSFSTGDIRHDPVSASVVVFPLAMMVIAGWGSWYLVRNWEFFP